MQDQQRLRTMGFSLRLRLVSTSLLRLRTDSQEVLAARSLRSSASRSSSLSLRSTRSSFPRYSASLTWYLRSRMRRLISGVLVRSARVGLASGAFSRHQKRTRLSSREQGSFLGRASLMRRTRSNSLGERKGGWRAQSSQTRQPSAQTSVCLLQVPLSTCSGDRQCVCGSTVEASSSSPSSRLLSPNPPSFRFFLDGSAKQTCAGSRLRCRMLSLWTYSSACANWQNIRQTSSSGSRRPSLLASAISSCSVPPRQYSITMSTVTSFLLMAQSRQRRMWTQSRRISVLTSLTMCCLRLGDSELNGTFFSITSRSDPSETALKRFFERCYTIWQRDYIQRSFLNLTTIITKTPHPHPHHNGYWFQRVSQSGSVGEGAPLIELAADAAEALDHALETRHVFAVDHDLAPPAPFDAHQVDQSFRLLLRRPELVTVGHDRSASPLRRLSQQVGQPAVEESPEDLLGGIADLEEGHRLEGRPISPHQTQPTVSLVAHGLLHLRVASLLCTEVLLRLEPREEPEVGSRVGNKKDIGVESVHLAAGDCDAAAIYVYLELGQANLSKRFRNYFYGLLFGQFFLFGGSGGVLGGLRLHGVLGVMVGQGLAVGVEQRVEHTLVPLRVVHLHAPHVLLQRQEVGQRRLHRQALEVCLFGRQLLLRRVDRGGSVVVVIVVCCLVAPVALMLILPMMVLRVALTLVLLVVVASLVSVLTLPTPTAV